MTKKELIQAIRLDIAGELEAAKAKTPKALGAAVQKVIQKIMKKHGRIIYNGDGYTAAWQKEAAKRGLDPDKWFNHVEIVTAEKIGIETTTYVRNIYKYYVAYKLLLDAQTAADQARQQVTPVAR